MLKKSLCLLRLEVKFRQAWVHRSDCFLSLGPCRESANGRCSDGLWNFFKNGGKLMDYLLEWFTNLCLTQLAGETIQMLLLYLPWYPLASVGFRFESTFGKFWICRPSGEPLIGHRRCRWNAISVPDASGATAGSDPQSPGYFRIWKIVVGVKILWKFLSQKDPPKRWFNPREAVFFEDLWLKKHCRTSKKRRSSRWNCKTLSWWKPYACVVQLPVLTVW